MLQPDFERRLIENIHPVRQFFLAQALHHSLELGLFTLLGETPGVSAADIADKLELHQERLTGLLHYLQNEGYLVENDGWRRSAKGEGLPVFAPWYEMLVGGYAPTMQQLGDALKKGAPFATRDSHRVGVGSCGIGRYDALPLVEKLLEAAGNLETLVDLGCGDGAFLIDILLERPNLRGIGMDPTLESIELGAERGVAAGVSDRFAVSQGTAGDVAKLELPDGGKGTAFMTAFILQEVLEQEGEAAVEELLRATFETYPEATWLVVEMDHQPTAPVMGTHGLALAFYNPYFLIHQITEQRLGTDAYWHAMFDKLGLKILAKEHPDPRADSTGIQMGYLLARA